MNREILFKAKDREDGEWIEGLLSKCDNQYVICDDSGTGIFIDENTICQYTGLTTKYGDKIWENDIVNVRVTENAGFSTRKYEDTYQVTYHNEYCYFYLKKKKNNLLFDGNWSYFTTVLDVVGNIFDNPELVKGE